jgi:hypothetical protein
MGDRDAVGIPPSLLHRPLRVFRTADAAEVYVAPRPQLARLVTAGLVHRLAGGWYVIVPPEFTGLPWRPGVEAAAGGIGAALFGTDTAVVMGLSAARVHGAVPRGLGVGIVAVPRQRRPLALTDRAATVVFVTRAVDRIDAEMTHTEVGHLLVTGIEQTALDLAHRPELGGLPDQAREAAVTLHARCQEKTLESLAEAQRLRAAADRLRRWAV